MKNCLRIICSLVLLLAAVSINKTLAQDQSTAVDKMFSFATGTTPGCACAVSQNGKPVLSRNYGLADLEKGVPISNPTVFDIGSTRKQFIAATILLLVQDKKLSLKDDIRKFIPELPDYGHKITVDHLLTHTSGIRDWTGILPLASGDPTALNLILRQKSLNFIPGDEWSYSNSGFVLLTVLAERITKLSFADLIRQRLFEPLGLKATTYVADMQQAIPNRALGYARQAGGFKVNMYLGNDRGGGAIFSNVTDLVAWNDALTSGRLGNFVTGKLQEAAHLNNGRKLGYARGLTLENYKGVPLIWHSGGAAGYHTWLGRVPSQGLSIAITCNADVASASSLGDRLLNLYVKPAPEGAIEEEGSPAALSGDALAQANQYSGLYFNKKTGDALTLAVDRDRFRVAGGPGLVPVAKGHFRRWGNSVYYQSQDKFELLLKAPGEIEYRSMEGRTSIYGRAQVPVITNAQLDAYTGRFQSDELGATIEVKRGDGVLMAHLNDNKGEGIAAKPVGPDTFQFRGIFFRFLRDKSGKIIALSYSNPVVQHLRFVPVK